MEPEHFLSRLQELSIGPYPELRTWIQSITTHPISLRSILSISSHLSLGLPTGLFVAFPSKRFSPCVLYALSVSSSLTWLV
jgi:hypothetical protein